MTLTCVGEHSHNHVGAGGELVHVELVVARRPGNRRLRRLQPVQLGVCPVADGLCQRATLFKIKRGSLGRLRNGRGAWTRVRATSSGNHRS